MSVLLASSVACRFSDILWRPNASRENPAGSSSESLKASGVSLSYSCIKMHNYLLSIEDKYLRRPLHNPIRNLLKINFVSGKTDFLLSLSSPIVWPHQLDDIHL